MRDAIDKYYGDLGHYPEELATLVEKHYLRSIPVDPIADSAEHWVAVQNDEGEDHGVRDVKSGAEGTAQDGSSFAEW
jgi:general secretion pathway protein G